MAPLIPSEVPAFKTKYNIPDDVEVKVAGKDEPLIGSRERIPIYTRTITEGGVRFPLDPLLLWVLSAMKFCPIQCCPNFFRIVMGVAALNRILNLNLGLWEILYCYILKPAGDTFYLAVRQKDRYLVTHLPDSNKGHENDIVFVSGNWEYVVDATPSYRCPYEEGSPGETVKGRILESAVKMDELRKVWDFNESLFCRAACLMENLVVSLPLKTIP